MDPYRNWSSGASLEDDSSDSSPPAYARGGGKPQAARSSYGETRGSRQSMASSSKAGDDDVYDFEISDDDAPAKVTAPRRGTTATTSSSSARMSSNATSSGTSTVRQSQGRLSMDERTQEILRRNQIKSSVSSSPATSPVPSPKGAGGRDSALDWKRSLDDLMEVIHSPDADVSPLSPSGGPQSPKFDANAKTDLGDSSYGDSLEITAADLEVGEYAARRLKEKTQDRQARMALSVAPHTLVNKQQQQQQTRAGGIPQAKVAASPDLTSKTRVRESNIRGSAGGFQMSAALSSINRSRDDDFSDDEDIKGVSEGLHQRYGSLEKSDERVYKMLNAGKGNPIASTSDFTRGSAGLKPPAEREADDNADDRDDDDDDDDDDGSGDSELAQSNEEMNVGRRGNTPQNAGEKSDSDDFEEEDEPAEEDAKETTAEERERKYAEIRQRWLGGGAQDKSEAPVATAETAGSEQQNVEATEEPAPPAPAPELSKEDDDEDEGDKEDEGERYDAYSSAPLSAPLSAPQVQVGINLLTAIGSASMVTSVPPPAPPIMSASADFNVTTSAEAGHGSALGMSTMSGYSDNSDSLLHGADIEPPAYVPPSALPDEVMPAPASVVDARESRANLRYSSANLEDQDASLLMEEEEDMLPGTAPTQDKTASNAPVTEAPPVIPPTPPSVPVPPTLQDIVPTLQTKPVIYIRPSSGENVTAGDHNVGVDTHGRTVLAFTGQAALNKIVAFEIDPAALGLPPPQHGLGSVAASVSVKSRTHSSPLRMPAAPTTWPKELPLTAGSTAELHAHIAMMETTQKRRIAAATQAKIKSFRNKSADEAGLLASLAGPEKKGARKVVKRGGAAVTNSSAVPSAVNRLEQGTARLARQYEQLQQEMQSLKSSIPPHSVHVTRGVQASSTASRSIVASSSGVSPHRAGSGRSPSRIPTAKSAAAPTPAAPAHSNDPAPSFPEDDSGLWQSAAMHTMKKIVEEGDRLADREKDLKNREEALRIRQSVAEAGTYAALSEAALQAQSKSSLTAPPAHRARDEEFIALQRAEAQAQGEIDRLKALLFELQNPDSAADVNTSIPIKPPRRTHYAQRGKSAGTHEKGDAEEKGEENPDVVSIPRAEYDKLLQEVASQETLITGFQKENEKLVAQLRLREAEDNSKRAHFFDQQESLNKELNRLRNVAGLEGDASVPSNTRKSAEMLRAELDADATIRALKERIALAESGAGMREKEMQQTIDKLRKENRSLAAASAQVSAGVFAGQDEDQAVLAEQKRLHEEEVKALRAKLAWYAENQVLLESAEKAKEEALVLANALKRELKKRGVDAKTIAALSSAAKSSSSSPPSSPEDADTSTISQSTKARAPHRSPADVKKIKDLEEAVAELQECLRKRHPDSISSLVRAAQVSDSVQLERKQQEEHVVTMAKELADAKTNFELRLRSIRQEHEKLEMGYKARIASLEAITPSSTPSKAASPGSQSKVGTAPVKTMAQATIRIKELEEEAERIRTFYTKRVEDVQRKADLQIRALKRGSPADDEAPATPAADAFSSETPATPGDNMHSLSIVAVRSEYEERLKMMEVELVRTAEELGAVKAAAASAAQSVQSSGHERIPMMSALNSVDIRQHPHWAAEVEREVDSRVMRYKLAEMEKRLSGGEASSAATSIAGATGNASTSNSASDAREKEQWASERERLQVRLRDEEARVNVLSGDVARLRAQLQEQATSPQATQLQALESQMVHLETRLQRREKELTQAAEDGRNASKLERARLEALHLQELREKDEQLVRFQQELEQLVYALRQWQLAASSGEVNPGMYHPPPSNASVFV